MSWRRLIGLPDDPRPLPDPDIPVSLEQIYFHVNRFERAVAQNAKGPERARELQRQLDYWRSRRAAEHARLEA